MEGSYGRDTCTQLRELLTSHSAINHLPSPIATSHSLSSNLHTTHLDG